MSWLRLGRSSTSTSTSSSRNGGGSRSQGLDSAGIYVEPFFDLNPPLFIIHPNSARPGGPAKTSTTVSGHFEIELEHQETFQQLSARLFPRYYATDGANHKDRGELPGQTCHLQTEPQQYGPGKHSFPFVFELPCDAPPYTDFAMQEPSWIAYGKMYRLRYLLEIRIVRLKPGSDPTVHLQEWPHWQKPIGPLDLAEAQKKTEKRFHVTTSPSDPGEMPPSLSLVMENITPQLGFVRVRASSRFFMIGGIITLDINISAAEGTKVEELRCSIRETASWHSPTKAGLTWSEKPRKYAFFTKSMVEREDDHAPRGASSSSSSRNPTLSTMLHLLETVRLPSDHDACRSSISSKPHTMHVKHELLFEIAYRRDGQKFVGALSEPVILAGCELISEALRPPAYGVEPLSAEALQPDRIADLEESAIGYVFCTCGFSMDMLIAREREGLALSSVVTSYDPTMMEEATRGQEGSNAHPVTHQRDTTDDDSDTICPLGNHPAGRNESNATVSSSSSNAAFLLPLPGPMPLGLASSAERSNKSASITATG